MGCSPCLGRGATGGDELPPVPPALDALVPRPIRFLSHLVPGVIRANTSSRDRSFSGSFCRPTSAVGQFTRYV